MKSMDFLTLLGELDPDITPSDVLTTPTRRPAAGRKRRGWKWAVAACICVGLLAFATWFFAPPSVVVPDGSRFTVIRVEDRLASYRYINTRTLSPYQRLLLPDTPGELLCTHGGHRFYRAQGKGDLVYLLQERDDGSYDLLQFDGYVSTGGMDMTESYWYTSGWLTDEDIAALTEGEEPTMLDLLDTIYSVTSAEDIEWVRFSKDSAHNGGVCKRVKVKSVTVTDREAIGRLYGLFPRFHTEEYGQRHDYGSVEAHDEAYLTGEKPLSAQVDREVTVRLTSGRELRFQYYPAAGLLRQTVFEMYTNLSETDNAWLIDLANIDMQWHDWGTEEPSVGGAEMGETATVEPIPKAETP